MAQLKDSVVSGNLRVTDTTLTDTLQVTTVKAPTTAGGTTYGPGTYTKGYEITGLENFDGQVLHMGTAIKDGKLVTNGGRVLMCIAHGDDIRQAQQKVYTEMEKIHCSNLFYRKDIAHWAL